SKAKAWFAATKASSIVCSRSTAPPLRRLRRPILSRKLRDLLMRNRSAARLVAGELSSSAIAAASGWPAPDRGEGPLQHTLDHGMSRIAGADSVSSCARDGAAGDLHAPQRAAGCRQHRPPRASCHAHALVSGWLRRRATGLFRHRALL